MGDAPNELEVLEARREILQLEIALAQERRAAAEAEQKGRKTSSSRTRGRAPSLRRRRPTPGRRTVTWPVTTTWQMLGRMLLRYDRMRRRVCSRATYFFNLGEKARGDAFARWLPVALRAVGAAAPPNGHYAPKSFRSGFASAVTAMNVSPDRRNYIAGWAANSHAVGTHYVDNSVVVDDAARFLFGHLIGLPPPPVEVPVAPVAPWSSPLANLASRFVTLVSPLRGET